LTKISLKIFKRVLGYLRYYTPLLELYEGGKEGVDTASDYRRGVWGYTSIWDMLFYSYIA